MSARKGIGTLVMIFVTVATVFLALVVEEQQRTIDAMLASEQAQVTMEAALSADVQSLRRQVLAQDEIIGQLIVMINDIQFRHDILVAASRSGWADAHRMIRSLEREGKW